MAIRAAVLTKNTCLEPSPLQAALQEVSAKMEVCILPAHADRPGRRWRPAMSRLAARLPFGAMVQLAAYRPDLVISEAFGTRALQAALYRTLSTQSRLLLCATEKPRRYGLLERVVLSRADGFLADRDDVAEAVESLRFPVSRIYSLAIPSDVELFFACPRHRHAEAAHRLIYAGALSPESGAADFLVCVAAWAEQNPDRMAEVWWAGEGDLSGVLEAQPLPDNMSQRFLGELDRRGMAAAMAECGILVVPPTAEDSLQMVPEALSAGLVVLRSRRSGKARQIVRDGVLGWSFDPLRQDDMLDALGQALGSSADELNRMRDSGLALLRNSATESLAERVQEAIAAVLSHGLPGTGAVKS